MCKEFFNSLCALDWNATATFFASGVALLIAVFQESIRRWMHRPKLALEFENHQPFIHSFSNLPAVQVQWVAYRLGVRNSGTEIAKKVRVSIEKIEIEQNQRYEELNPFVPTELKWMHTDSGECEIINIGISRYVNLCNAFLKAGNLGILPDDIARNERISDSDIGIELLTTISPRDGYNIIGPGKYRITLVTSAENAAPTYHTLNLSFGSRWDDMHPEAPERARDNPIRLNLSRP